MDSQRIDEDIKAKQDAYLNEALERAGQFEEMVKTKGWETVLAFYQNSLKSFFNDLMTSDKPITDFEDQRQQLMGVRKFVLGQVEGTLKVLEDYRANQKKDDKTS